MVACLESGSPNAEGRDSMKPTVSISLYLLKRGSDGCCCLGSRSISPVVGSYQCNVIPYGRYW